MNKFEKKGCCYCQTNNYSQNLKSQSKYSIIFAFEIYLLFSKFSFLKGIRRRYTVNNHGSGYLINRYTNGSKNKLYDFLIIILNT